MNKGRAGTRAGGRAGAAAGSEAAIGDDALPVAGLERGVVDLLREAGYSERAIGYYLGKVNVGSLPRPCVRHAYTGPCGDTLELFLLFEEGIITKARFQSIGCVGSFVAGSALTTMLVGMTREQAALVTVGDVIGHLGAIPEAKAHCALLSVRTLKGALGRCRERMRRRAAPASRAASGAAARAGPTRRPPRGSRARTPGRRPPCAAPP